MSRRRRPLQCRIRDRRTLAAFVAEHPARMSRTLRQLEVFEMHVVRGLSISATARVLDRSQKTVRNHLNRLRRAALTWAGVPNTATLTLPERRTA